MGATLGGNNYYNLNGTSEGNLTYFSVISQGGNPSSPVVDTLCNANDVTDRDDTDCRNGGGKSGGVTYFNI